MNLILGVFFGLIGSLYLIPIGHSNTLRFPDGFRWCAATAAHQIEGYNSNSDWWDWELIPGKVKNGEHSGPACDHWNRVQEDVAILRDLGMKTYRFSVEWAKIEPQPGVFDHDVITHYRNELRLLSEAGIEPMITLHHFTFPKWVRAQGGWEWDGIQEAFARYADVVITQIGPDVVDWITINEPYVHILGGYYVGLTPPGETRAMKDLVPVVEGLLKSHALAYRTLHASAVRLNRKIRVGFAHHLRVIEPHRRTNPIDSSVARSMHRVLNWSISDAIQTGKLVMKISPLLSEERDLPELLGTEDFIGVNYYTRDFISYSVKSGVTFHPPDTAPKNDLGWEIYPEGIYQLLTELANRYPGKPVFITENGLADSTDTQRPQFIQGHLSEVHRAITAGVPVEGYCHWSLMDNFEWVEGFEPRFGLFEVDYSTFKRSPRPSAFLYEGIARSNALVQ